MPREPAPTRWGFPDLAALERSGQLPDDDLLATGADLEPATVLAAYRVGLFPMPDGPRGRVVGWWSPVERGVLPLERLRVTRSMRQSARGLEVRVDTAFDAVVAACADPGRPGAWISPAIRRAYGELHALGWAHSVETWRDDELVGGLYGVAIGGLFAGESMFHRARDASKVALMGLADLLRDDHAERRLVDVQWQTPHLATLGVVGVSREEYLTRLDAALAVPLPEPWR